MALLDPRRPDAPGDNLHPAVGLVAGFGLIIVAAIVVHVVFNVLI
jgi:hypothetical protein